MNKVCSNLFEYELVEANKRPKALLHGGNSMLSPAQ
jgi:hypothetical protein